MGQPKEASKETDSREEELGSAGFFPKYPVLKSPIDFKDRIKTKTLGTDGFMINHETVELRYLEQLVCSGQNTAPCRILINLVDKYFGKQVSLDGMVDEIVKSIERYGPDALFNDAPYVPEGLTFVKKNNIIPLAL